MTLNISASSVEHSLLAPDDGVTITKREIPVFSLLDYCKSKNIERLDFVKIEAEGVELEVFEGLDAIRPRKIAIDVSPERDGQSPAEEFKIRLAKMNYEFRQRAHVLFARPRGASVTVSPGFDAGKESKPPRTKPTLPRQIYSLWLQGIAQAPALVQWNLARWRSLNPDYAMTVLEAPAIGN